MNKPTTKILFDIEKLNNLEKHLSKNLMEADGKTWEKEYKPFWINYRNDVPKCLMVIREFKDLLKNLEKNNG